MDNFHNLPPEAHIYFKASANFRNRLNTSERKIITGFLWNMTNSSFSTQVITSPKYNKKSYTFNTQMNKFSSVHLLVLGSLKIEMIIHEHGKKFDVVSIDRLNNTSPVAPPEGGNAGIRQRRSGKRLYEKTRP